ncbi:MAG TPA: CBS domain-containing protein [Actinomycetota bacterium]|nr:CBS domain-containing protein [Actinomycetota bacterium]
MPSLREIMSADVFTTTADAPIAEVAQRMMRGKIGSAVVMDGTWLVGIFTERDVLRAAAAGADPKASVVRDWMTGDPVTAAPDMDAEEAAELMMSQGFRHLPVVDGNALVGLASLRDIFRTRIRRPAR